MARHSTASCKSCKSPNTPSEGIGPPLREESVTYVSGTFVTYEAGRSLSWWRETVVQELEP